MTSPLLDRRPEKPSPMSLTERDKRILEAIHAFDGMLSAPQIQRLFFDSWRQTRERLSKLYQNGYLARPDRRGRAALSCMVYWLDEKGAEYLANLNGQDLSEFSWRKPGSRWSLVEHDLAVNDFRITVAQACSLYPDLELEEWIPSGEFWAYPDTVEYTNQRGRKVTRRVRPDGCFAIVNRQAKSRWRFLLEIDRSSEDNPRFGRDKVLPGMAYLRSGAYERRFGGKSGRWLVVTTGERRMANMKRQTEVTVGNDADAKVFSFTTFEAVKPETVLAAPIWYRGGESEPVPLLRLD